MRHGDWQDLMLRAGIRASCEDVQRYVRTLSADTLDRLIRDNDAWTAACLRRRDAGGPRHLTEWDAECDARREVMIAHARKHNCHLDALTFALDGLARALKTV